MSTFFKIQTYKKPSQYSQYSEHEGKKAIIGNNGNEFAAIEKSLLQTKYTATYFSANAQGRPGFCIHCPSWTQKGKGVWWSGSCLHTGERKSNKSRCSIEVWEAA